MIVNRLAQPEHARTVHGNPREINQSLVATAVEPNLETAYFFHRTLQEVLKNTRPVAIFTFAQQTKPPPLPPYPPSHPPRGINLLPGIELGAVVLLECSMFPTCLRSKSVNEAL